MVSRPLPSLSYAARRERIRQAAPLYQEASLAQKGLLLDRTVAVTGYARKYAIRLLNQIPQCSAPTVYRFLISLRKKQRIIWKPEVPQAPLQDFSANEAVWLFARDPTDLDEKEQETLRTICQASETARTTYQLVQEIRSMLHHYEGEKLDDWLANVTKSGIRELRSFVLGVEQDKTAVVAGLTFPQNNGQTEGQVTRIKLIKRMMYGRAGFALLRQRVLHYV
jgi:transposase